MTVPSPPYVDYKSPAFKDINNAGQVIIDGSFCGRLDELFVANQVNNEVVVTISVIKEDVDYEYSRDILKPNEKRSFMVGTLKYIELGDVFFIKTDYPTNLVICSPSYVIFNELS